MKIQLSELLLDLPPPETLDLAMSMFPLALLATYHKGRTILIGSPNGFASRLGNVYQIPYYGYSLPLVILKNEISLRTLERRVNAMHPKAIAILFS